MKTKTEAVGILTFSPQCKPNKWQVGLYRGGILYFDTLQDVSAWLKTCAMHAKNDVIYLDDIK